MIFLFPLGSVVEPEPDFLAGAGAGAGAVEITSAPGHHLQVNIFANYFFSSTNYDNYYFFS